MLLCMKNDPSKFQSAMVIIMSTAKWQFPSLYLDVVVIFFELLEVF